MAREQGIDIHEYARQYANAERAVRQEPMSERNKAFIFRYRDACLRMNVCGIVRLLRVFGVLTLVARHTRKDFDTLTREDLERLLSDFLRATPAYSPETLGTYKAIIKKFFTWLAAPHAFPHAPAPALVSWITCHVRSKDRRRLQRRELLTPDEAQRLITMCRTPRDRAFTSTLWESGTRIAEIGNLQIKHVTKHKYGYVLDVRGKTGERTPLVVASAPYLSAWLAFHPYGNDPDAPLWVSERYRTPTPVLYPALRKLLITLFARAGIKKRPNPHGLRHARATDLAATGRMNETQLKIYLGWASNSTMPGNYTHLTSQDANNAILAEHGLRPNQQATPAPLVRPCPTCAHINPPAALLCVHCGSPLDASTAITTRENRNALVLKLAKLLVEHGLLDDATAAIHEAGLGKTLKQLANQPMPETTLPEATRS